MKTDLFSLSGWWRAMVFGRNPKRTLLRLCVWTASINLFFHSLLLPIQVEGSSMTPTYQSGMLNLVNRLAYLRQEPERGDVVVLDLGRSEGLLIKRIVGLPGEEITIRRGQIFVDGRMLSDEYACAPIPWETDPLRLGENEYFFIGDNRANSVFGLTSRDRILGEVVF